jgi:23S rRNA pseudouridine1911/1915/1917 synthase
VAQTLQFTTDRAFRRLDLFLAEQCCELSRSEVQRLIAEGHVTVDGATALPATKLGLGRQVSVNIPDPVESELVPEELPLSIVYQDSEILVVDKAAGMTVHPAPGHPTGTLANAVLALCPDLRGIGGKLRPGIVHRLDKNTSGLMVVAKTQQAHTRLSSQLKARRFEKVYLTLVHGNLSPERAVIEAPIGRDPRNRKRMAVVADGRAAITRYSVVERPRGYSLVEVRPVTGRTHQIRVHMSAVGHPVVGDGLYGRTDPSLDRHFLHAQGLGFKHPSTGSPVEFQADLPPDLRAFLDQARR